MEDDSNRLEIHYKGVVRAITHGRLVPFLGAGANLCNHPPGIPWQPGSGHYLPSGAELAQHLAEQLGRRRLVVVSTNYDDLLERAFAAREERFHLFSYIADGEHQGKFVHWPPGDPGDWPPTSEPRRVDSPNDYGGLPDDDSDPVILKIHGSIDRPSADVPHPGREPRAARRRGHHGPRRPARGLRAGVDPWLHHRGSR